ncbi:Cysteine proteinase [Venustampulla echinocandica]|uniref:Cysteine proteinase n=1 Tax=Venustampulla echinocandica TaxID=2656787 RepID=A0A370TRG5_9HELO|nr:Cysteine proteinase [Venustampulla echinocandica]RDL38126.1 Cysteine proteinase [Venustampulla echinocandica]
MDHDHKPTELSRERAASSEPCSTRPNPFDETETSSRKRQRVSRGGSRSQSVDTSRNSDIGSPSRSRSPRAGSTSTSTSSEADPALPRTPTRIPSKSPLPEPTSSRVTINLRTARPLESIPSSPPSPTTPSKMVDGGEDSGTRVSVGSESDADALSAIPPIETPSSSPSATGSPTIELVPISEDDEDFEGRSPPVAIFDGDAVLSDPMPDFPYLGDDSLVDGARKVARYLQFDDVPSEEAFCKLRDWMEKYLLFTTDSQTRYENYTKYREFWPVFPEIFWALNARSRFFGQFLQRSRPGRQAVTDMFCQFSRITGRFVSMDVKTLAFHTQDENIDQEPDLSSRKILSAYGFLLRKEEPSHIGKNLETHYNWNWDDDVALMTSNFQAEGGSIPNLTKLVRGQLRLIPRLPKSIDSLVDPCRLVAKTVIDAAGILEELPGRQYVESTRQHLSQGYEFFKVMSAGLELIIDKHVTCLAPDAAHHHLVSLTHVLSHSFASENDAIRELLERRQQEHPQLSRKQLPKVISYEWRFTILEKLLTSAQMQLRVVGVTTMCGDLLHLYNTSKGDDPPRSPVLLSFANFVLEHKLVDYIVGIGSHPEIINESHNILGFLIVTKTYTAQVTDRIWQTVMSSQDPRVVESILRMIKQCMNLYDYQALLYICQKAGDLPIEAFNTHMRDFCEHLLRNIITKGIQDGIQHVDAAPYDLCVRLIRESSITTAESPAGHLEIQNFAVPRFRDLLVHGPTGSTRKSIYESCIEDISLRTSTAPGSICILNVLLRPNLATDLHLLTAEHGLTRLLVEELEHSTMSDQHSPEKSTPASLARRELLHLVILQEPGTISPDLGQRLWANLVGSESQNAVHRNTAWTIFNSAAKKSPNNIFISTCFEEYLPNLPPHCFTTGALEFARAAVTAWLEEATNDFPDNDSFESPALEQIWRMILNAPPNTIDAAAINILVEVYVDNPLIASVPRPRARNIHLALVDRCLRQLAAAASKLKSFGDGALSGEEDGMVIVPSEAQFQEQERIFARSLAVLREFLKSYQSKPHFAIPKPKVSVSAASSAIEGDPLTVKYQSFDGNTHTEIRSLTLGKLNTAASLFASLQKATGFQNYKVYYGGKEFDPDEIEVCKSLADLNLNGLVLIQRCDNTDGSVASDGNKMTLELEIMKHFEQLWSCLSMHESVAKEIYYFLIKFPVYDRLLTDFDSEATSYTEIFPQGQPFKSLYAIHTLREYIAGQSQKGGVKSSAMARAISLVVAAISDPDVLGSSGSEELRDCLALHLIDCLVQFLKEPILPVSIAPYLNETLQERLLQLLYDTKSAATTPNSVHLTWSIFEALLEASLHNSDLWNSFVSHLKRKSLLRDLLLEDPRPVIRKSVVKQIVNKCTFTPSLAQVSTMSFVVEFWPMVATLILEAAHQPLHCEEIFFLGQTLFKKLAETSLEFLNLEDLVKHWGSLLLSHECNESVGHPESIDLVAQGLTNLLLCATSFAKASQQSMSCSSIGTQLFQKHLFPATHLAESYDNDTAFLPRIPLLNPITRHAMSETVFSLVKDNPVQYEIILKNISDLVPYDDAIEDGTYELIQGNNAADVRQGPYHYDLPYLFDRSKSIRSPTGYVGLRNLSNTCYLNSLFTQLFMNVPFREFMLNALVADGGASQKLLSETQILFANMQNSLTRFVDPQNLASSIRTYDETPIDVTIQMDVDEFYNLLFDRWESQILASEAKKKFRSFYGGQLVQQVKSKECPHISERLEVFSAIQCDIKGKSSLEESLQAYVDGEIMEGDNKYKCSTCDRHVDAVKRACLKDIPDNLIFHLKRFDFNLRTLQRSKINDYFSFPNKLDMRPYKVEHLMDSPEDIPEDIFELVGILVHAGTAESGHYYSYIRERPSTGDKDNWVEFNDDSVTPWEPSCMDNSCFGGIDYRSSVDNGNMTYDKNYSAYMLFYQRSSVLAAQKQTLEKSQLASPIRLPLPAGISNQISMENELLMRKYCLYDPSHIAFVSKMLLNVKKLGGGQCSLQHQRERTAMFAALNHLDQVVARTKDIPDFQTFSVAIRQVCNSCVECTRDNLEWFSGYPEALRHLLLRNPDTVVRNETASSILASLIKVKAEAPYAYGFNEDESVSEEEADNDPQLIQGVVGGLNRLWDMFHSNCRAWPEYFGLLVSIATLGELEAALLLDRGYLRRTLEIVSADPLLNLTPQLSRMLNIISKRVATRPVSFDSVIGLLHRLLEVCDFSQDPLLDHAQRFDLAANGEPIPLTTMERDYLTQHWTKSNSHILVEKLLQINQNQPATRSILIMLLLWPEDDLDVFIHQAIMHGIRKGTTGISCGAFLRAALVYCEYSESSRLSYLIQHISKIASHLDNADGKEFLRFFQGIVKLPSTRNIDIPPKLIFKLCLDEIRYWGPGLLTYYDHIVRTETEEFLQELIFGQGADTAYGSSLEDAEMATLVTEAAQRLGIACLDYLNDAYVQPRQQAVRATLVSILTVIENCEMFFDEEKMDLLTRRFYDLRASVLPALKKYTVDEADEEVSDWAGSDDEYGSSEPMGESITELCAPLADDLNDAEVQL